MSVPVFSNRASLSLASLDAMGDIVRKNEQTLKSMGAVRVPGAARAAPAWYVPSPVAGVGSAVGFTCISPGTIGAVDISRAYQVPLIINGKLHLPMAHNHINHEIDPEDNTVDYYPGAIDSIDVREGTPATLEHGTICLPLAESPTVETDDISGIEFTSIEGWAGLLQGVEWSTSIDRPVINTGIMRLPLAQFKSGVGLSDSTRVTGAIAGVEYRPELTDPQITNGVLQLPPGGATTAPLAWFGRDVGSPVAGTLRGGECAAITAIAAVSGVLYFPLASRDVMPAANDSGTSVDGSSTCTVCSVTSIPYVPGAVCGAQMDYAATAPYIASGVLYFPQQGNLKGIRDIEGTYHTFEQMETYVGAQVQVAGITIRTASNSYVTIELYAGYEGGYLDFSFSTNTPA